jgi:hypothetical protein
VKKAEVKSKRIIYLSFEYFFQKDLNRSMDRNIRNGRILASSVSFFLNGLVMLIGTQYEYYLMIRNTGVRPQMVTRDYYRDYCICDFNTDRLGSDSKKSFLVLIPMMLIIMVIELYRKQDKPFDSLAHTFFSVLYTAYRFQCSPLQHSREQALIQYFLTPIISFFTGNNYWFFYSYMGK